MATASPLSTPTTCGLVGQSLTGGTGGCAALAAISSMLARSGCTTHLVRVGVGVGVGVGLGLGLGLRLGLGLGLGLGLA